MFSMLGDGCFLYSNYGFVLASYLAERVTGKTYSTLVYVIAPAVGAFFGWLYGTMINGRVIIGSANWVPTYLVLGGLWGLGGATRYRGMFKKDDPEKGKFLTETKAYKKKITKQEEQNTKDEQK